MTDVVIASANPGKIKEFTSLLAPLGYTVFSQSDFHCTSVKETGLSYLENALLKARAIALQTGKAVIADDSGLSIDCLHGMPGIYSARYSQADALKNGMSMADFKVNRDKLNCQKMIATLKEKNCPNTSARYHAVLVFLRYAEDPLPLIAHGVLEGEICFDFKGDNGFGYDPIFHIPALGKRAAEISQTEKNAVSHRGNAMRDLIQQLSAISSFSSTVI